MQSQHGDAPEGDEKGTTGLVRVAPVFPVTDVARALEYYSAALMFSVAFEWAGRAGERPRYAVLCSGGCELHITHSDRPHPAVACVQVRDAAALFRRLRGNGAEIVHGVEDTPWNMRQFEVRDRDGNRLVFAEALPFDEDTGQDPGSRERPAASGRVSRIEPPRGA